MQIKSETVEISELTLRQRKEMLKLMQDYFKGVGRASFEKDLSEKQWAVILSDENGSVCGFTTLMLSDAVVAGEKLKVFYSGDTIVDKKHWGIFSLEKRWIPFVFENVLSDPGFKWYWFFVSKGYRTFRYLPVHFKKYWPSPENSSCTFENKLLNKLAGIRFGKSYDPLTGVVCCENDYRLRSGVGDISDREMRCKHVRFFLEKNPCWRKGAQLACLTELSVGNLRPMLLKMLRKELRIET